MNNGAKRIDWLFGRGLSIGCGLYWSVPGPWATLPRAEAIGQIKEAIRAEMDSTQIDCSSIHSLLKLLSERTAVHPWRHMFLTTNWDFLLQREVLALGHKTQPAWSAETNVFHLNGTVEVLPENKNRSPFLLESDGPDQRMASIEANIAFTHMAWNRTSVVVGMSFECEVDKFLLTSLNRGFARVHACASQRPRRAKLHYWDQILALPSASPFD